MGQCWETQSRPAPRCPQQREINRELRGLRASPFRPAQPTLLLQKQTNQEDKTERLGVTPTASARLAEFVPHRSKQCRTKQRKPVRKREGTGEQTPVTTNWTSV